MPAITPITATDRFAFIIETLCQLVAAQYAPRGRIPGRLVGLIWTRLRRLGARFAVIAERVHVGALSSPAVARTRDASRCPASRRPAQPEAGPNAAPEAEHRLPTGFAWLIRLAGSEAVCCGSQLRHLLSDPEMVALIAAAPQLGRVLRPLCRMLGVELTPELLPPRRARASSSEPGSPGRSRISRRRRGGTPHAPRPGPLSTAEDDEARARHYPVSLWCRRPA